MQGRLFGPDLPSSGVTADAVWNGERLRFELPQSELLSGALSIEAGGFNRRQLRLSFSTEQGSYAFLLELLGSEAFIESAPPSLRISIVAAQNQPAKLSRRLRWALVIAGGLGLVILLGGWLGLSWASTKLAERISPEQERRLGELVLAQTRATTSLIERGPALDAVRTIGSKLTQGSRYQYRYFLAQNPELNAFAAPGGIVVVNTGLIVAADSPEELAGVLSHEVAHAELRHGTSAMFKTMGVGTLWSWLLGGLNPDYARLAARFSELKFSRDAERQADENGLERLRAAAIAEGGMVTILDKLAQQNSNGLTPPTWLSTHPDIRERLAWLRQHVHQAPGTAPPSLPIDWKAVRADVSRQHSTP